MTITINVTQDDIDAANYARKYEEEKGPCCYCPIWQALNRVGLNTRFHVYQTYINFPDEDRLLILPAVATSFARGWDGEQFGGEVVSPVSFELDIPAEYIAA